MKSGSLKPPGTLWATLGLLRDSFTFTYLSACQYVCLSIYTHYSFPVLHWLLVLPLSTTNICQVTVSIQDILLTKHTVTQHYGICWMVCQPIANPQQPGVPMGCFLVWLLLPSTFPKLEALPVATLLPAQQIDFIIVKQVWVLSTCHWKHTKLPHQMTWQLFGFQLLSYYNSIILFFLPNFTLTLKLVSHIQWQKRYFLLWRSCGTPHEVLLTDGLPDKISLLFMM